MRDFCKQSWNMVLIFGAFLFVINVLPLSAQDTSSPELVSSAIWEKVADGLNFPEGPAWNGQGSLYFSNAYGDWIGRITSANVDTFLSRNPDSTVFSKTNGLTFDRNGNLIACDFGKGAILKFKMSGEVENYATGYENHPFNRPNDLAFDPEGNLYFTDPHNYDPEHPDGVVYKIFRYTKEVVPVLQDIAFPNGIAFGPNAEYLYICESARHRVDRFPIKENGTFDSLEVFAELPGGDPDGIAFDLDGNLYVAHFGGGAVAVFNPNGVLIKKILTLGKKPSNLEFGDSDMKTLYLTEDETNTIYSMRVETPGQPLFYSPQTPE